MLVIFFMNWNNIAFLLFWRKLYLCLDTFLFRINFQIMFRGLPIASSLSFNIRMLIISWAWAIFESRLLIIWRMSVSEKSQEVKLWSVSNFNSDVNMLLYGRALISERKELEISLFSLKSVTYSLLWKIGGMHGTFFSFSIIFNSDH